MSKRVLAAAILVVFMVTGCGSTAKNPASEAEKVAVEFYRSWFLDGDVGRAWDLATPDLWSDPSREAFVAYQLKIRDHVNRKRLPVDTDLRIQVFDRAGDYLFLISDKQEQNLIWVTKPENGLWLVRRFMTYHEGMDIPW
ncbi:MAG TPA: hypothetical protein VNT01_01250 [Symbiobacteriaceae bacterium]|nr:hypothetical protein [Symbiobacteriaceae bacterium]